MARKFRPSLNTTVGVALLVLLLTLGAIFVVYQQFSQAAVQRVAEGRISQTDSTCAEQVSEYLKDAELSLARLRAQLERPQMTWSQAEIEEELRTLMLYRPGLAEVTVIFPQSRDLLQLSVVRGSGRKLMGLKIERRAERIVEARGSVDQPAASWKIQPGAVKDPGQHATVKVFDDPDQQDVWTDLNYNPLDAALPPRQRRISVSFQGRCVRPAAAGRPERRAIIRMGLETEDLAMALGRIRPDGHEVLLCDYLGRALIRPEAMLGKADNGFEEDTDDLRLKKAYLTGPWEAALAKVGADKGANKGKLPSFRVRFGGEDYVGGALPVEGGQEWTVVVLAPEVLYLGPLRKAETGLLIAWCVLILCVGGLGICLKLFLARDLEGTERQVSELERFEFSSGNPTAHFEETQRVLDAMEAAKTSLRGFSKYAPINLVRQLHGLKSEPKLGGTLQHATVLFTDVANFTSMAESLAPDSLAQLLGLYLEVIADCIDEHGGVVDKYIGDATMALWNVPVALPQHPTQACAAAWQILQRTAQLTSRPDWQASSGGKSWSTRQGIHCDEVMVGHFGSPKRMNYTAMGDGVNLASRLESLNKVYGSNILVSDSVYDEARSKFVFCRLDRVAVVGKTASVEIYELVGPHGQVSADHLSQIAVYERALESYFARDFGASLQILAGVTDVKAARLLAERCVQLAAHPPLSWDGVYRPTKK